MTSLIYLYNVKFQDSENFQFDNDSVENVLETYLAKLQPLIFANYQYIKDCNQLYLTIKLKIEDAQNAITNIDFLNYNYCNLKINSVNHYYFIIGRKWISQNCIQLDLKNDVLNNYKFNESFKLNIFKTRVNREMQTRLEIVASDPTTKKFTFRRLFSIMKEGLNPKLYRVNDNILVDPIATLDSLYYLVYIANVTEDTQDLSKAPVDCYLASKDGARILMPISGRLITKEWMQEGVYYYLINRGDSGRYIYNYTTTSGTAGTIDNTTQTKPFTLIYLNNGSITAKVMEYSYNPTYFKGYSQEIKNISSISIPNESQYYIRRTTIATDYFEIWNTNADLEQFIFSSTNVEITIQDIHKNPNFSLSDSRIVKVIEIPYFPTPVGVNEQGQAFEDTLTPQWSYDTPTGFLKRNNIEEDTEREIVFNYEGYNDIHFFSEYLSSNKDRTLRNIERESKLFTSEFYYKKLSYDSFSFIYEIENNNRISYNSDDLESNNLILTYKVTSTINSKFLFEINSVDYLYANEDYYNFIIVARNNEKTIYNNSYITYLKTGYNYDVKARDRNNALTIASFANNAVSNVVRFASRPLESAFSSTFNIGSNIVNTIATIENNNDSFNRKQAEMQAQSTSVYGADDLDLMNYYSKGLLHQLEYRCIDEVRNLASDLFYFTGYTANKFGIPNLNNRAFFDFYSIDPVYSSVTGLNTDVLNELTAKMKEGVTRIHSLFIQEHDNFIFNFENWESEIYEKINK